tara:strand:+ start:181034 stop:181537 length:504 start_codon:yes stop_codon:yes gene_type:complete
MIVSLWRHGQAGSAATDRVRELTGTGTDDVGFGCHQFHDTCENRRLPPPDVILHSPWVRTRQTADIIATAFTHAAKRDCEGLAPDSGINDVEDAVSQLLDRDPGLEHVLLVMHQPLVSSVITRWLGDHSRVPALCPGGVASLSLLHPGPGCAQLLFWSFPPEYEAGL